MSDKSTGIDFDRQSFVQQERPAAVRAAGLIVALVVIVAVVLLGYKLLPSVLQGSGGSSADPTLADLDKRLSGIEARLDKLETSRKGVSPAGTAKKEEPAAVPENNTARPVTKTVYQISPAYRQPNHVGATAGVVTASTATADSGAAQRLPTIQQGLEALQNDTAANREAWQATTDRLADMAGQVGSQNVEILQSQDELNQLLAQTQREAIPFELVRGSNPQPVGPVSLALKASNPKTQRYTVCVYAQPSCIELKDHTLHEVVQFVIARNTTPLEFIATKILKDEVLGYLEVPRDQVAH